MQEKAMEIVRLLNELSEELTTIGVPKVNSGNLFTFDIREGWMVNPSMAYTLSQRTRELPENYAG